MIFPETTAHRTCDSLTVKPSRRSSANRSFKHIRMSSNKNGTRGIGLWSHLSSTTIAVECNSEWCYRRGFLSNSFCFIPLCAVVFSYVSLSWFAPH